MSALIIIWSMVAAAGLVIGAMHLLVSLEDHARPGQLTVAVLAFGAAAVTMNELSLMHVFSL